MSETEEKIAIHRGLKSVHFDRSRVCFIDGRAGEPRYRGYSIHDLAQYSRFSGDFCYLPLQGELPTQAQLAAFEAELRAARRLPDEILGVIRTVQRAHPMNVLRNILIRRLTLCNGPEPRDYVPTEAR